MKHTITHTLTLIALFIVSVAIASDPANKVIACRVLTEDDALYRVVYQAQKENQVTIKLTDKYDQQVYTEQLNTSAFNKKYDLSHLPNGDYEFEVKSGDFYYSEEVKIGDLSSFNFKFDLSSERKVAMVGSKKQDKQMTLYILDQEKEVVYKEQFDGSAQVFKRYDFADMRSDMVTFLLYHDSQLITEKEFVF